MNQKEFEDFVQEEVIVGLLGKLMGKKGEEYCRGGDRFWNFNMVSEFQINNKTKEAALWGMVIKHLQSCRDFIEDIDEGTYHTYPEWKEKAGDIIVYFTLLLGMAYDGVIEDPIKGEAVEQITLDEAVDGIADPVKPTPSLQSKLSGFLRKDSQLERN
jgi:hypothetical protein